ncbi:MAG: regulatory protein RecX [Clostridiales bacterium]|nr:regulatory protein RecX [Clostridiales bacterium]HBM79949.1 hypothetical protein [Clostridiaceae bacterium]
MIITSIVNKKNNKCDVYVDYEFSFSTDYEQIIKLGIKENECIDEEHLNEIILKCQSKSAFDRVLKYLEYGDRSESEIYNKLKELKYDKRTIEKVILKLKDFDYINDLRYAKEILSEEQKLKHSSIRKIAWKLANKGIKRNIISQVMAEADNIDLEAAIALAKKRMKSSNADANDKKFIQKTYRYLVGKGFDYDTSIKAVDACLKYNKDDF